MPSASSSKQAEYSAGNTGAELAKESREAAGEDEQAQFKHSAAVQSVAQLTGLSLEHAYLLCVLFNFAVMAGTILYFSKKNLPGVFRGRTASIQKALQEAAGRTPFKISSEPWWQDWAYFEVILREARTLIKGAPPKDGP